MMQVKLQINVDYEHIIRSTDEYERIANYIINNPAKWRKDKFFK